MSGWIGVDFDGTLSRYDGWVSETHCGDPIPAMVARVRQWLSEGKEVRVFTARVAARKNLDGTDRDLSHIVEAIQDWCEKHVGARLPVTNTKDYGMIELWDDRAVGIETNTGQIRAHHEIHKNRKAKTLDDDDILLLEHVARDLIEQFGPDVSHYIREEAEIAAGKGAAVTAEIWGDIADTVDRLLSTEGVSVEP